MRFQTPAGKRPNPGAEIKFQSGMNFSIWISNPEKLWVFFFFGFLFWFDFNITSYLLEIKQEWLVNSEFGGCFSLPPHTPWFLSHFGLIEVGGWWKKFAKQDNSWVEEKIVWNVNFIFLFLHLSPPTPPEDPPSSWTSFLANNEASSTVTEQQWCS